MNSTKSPPASSRDAELLPLARRTTWLGFAWILVIAATPVFRLLLANLGDRLILAVQVLIVLTLLLGRARKPFGSPLWIAAGCLIPVAGAVAGQASDVAASFSTAINLTILVGLLPFALRYFTATERSWSSRAITAFFVVQSISALAGILQLQLGLEFFSNSARDGRANGLAGHPNVLGFMCTIAILASAYLLPRASRKLRLLLVVVLSVNFFALLGTGSLSNLAGLIVGGILLLIAMRATIKVVFWTVTASLLSIPFFALTGASLSELTGGLQGRVDVVTGETSGVGSLQIRQQTWASAWARIQEDPFGGSGMDAMHQAVYGTTVTHNIILRFWYQGGLILLIALICVLIVMLGIIIRSLRTGRDAGPAAVLASIITFAMTSALYTEAQYWIPICLAVALVGLPGGRDDGSLEPAGDTPRTAVQTQPLRKG